MISLRTHNILDYVAGFLLIFAPYIFSFSQITTARNVFVVLGATVLVYSLLTNYYYSLVRYIPLGVHMTFDIVAGVCLMVAPWSLNYRDLLSPSVEYLHYVLGIVVFALVAVTREKTEEDKREHGIRVQPITTSRGL